MPISQKSKARDRQHDDKDATYPTHSGPPRKLVAPRRAVILHRRVRIRQIVQRLRANLRPIEATRLITSALAAFRSGHLAEYRTRRAIKSPTCISSITESSCSLEDARRTSHRTKCVQSGRDPFAMTRILVGSVSACSDSHGAKCERCSTRGGDRQHRCRKGNILRMSLYPETRGSCP